MMLKDWNARCSPAAIVKCVAGVFPIPAIVNVDLLEEGW